MQSTRNKLPLILDFDKEYKWEVLIKNTSDQALGVIKVDTPLNNKKWRIFDFITSKTKILQPGETHTIDINFRTRHEG